MRRSSVNRRALATVVLVTSAAAGEAGKLRGWASSSLHRRAGTGRGWARSLLAGVVVLAVAVVGLAVVQAPLRAGATGTTGTIAAAAGMGAGSGLVNDPSVTYQATSGGTDPVNTASGDFHETATDLSVPGPGPSLSLTRTYNSLAASTKGTFGYGWTIDYGMHLTTKPTGAVTIFQTDGSSLTAVTESGSLTFPVWADSSLTHTGNTYTFVRHQTETFTFASTGELTAISDPNGLATTLAYATGHL